MSTSWVFLGEFSIRRCHVSGIPVTRNGSQCTTFLPLSNPTQDWYIPNHVTGQILGKKSPGSDTRGERDYMFVLDFVCMWHVT